MIQSAIGQLDNSFSPIQLANYAATIANRGKRMKLTMVKSINDYTLDNTLYQHAPEVAQIVEAPQSSFETVIEGMVQASRIGTARAWFADYPVDVASKTGTPQTKEFPNSTFICFAPAEDPVITVAVVIEKGWHGYTARRWPRPFSTNIYMGVPIPQGWRIRACFFLKFCVASCYFAAGYAILACKRGSFRICEPPWHQRRKGTLMNQIYAVTSGKGGCGKTSICALLGDALARRGKRVLLVETDAGLRALDIMLRVSDQAAFDLADVLFGRTTAEKAVVPSAFNPNLFVLSAPFDHRFIPEAGAFVFPHAHLGRPI